MFFLRFGLKRNLGICILVILLFGCLKEPKSKVTASFYNFPSAGDLLTLFRFDASSSSLPTNDVWRIKVRWDFDNDGVWDTDFSLDKTATHRFKSPGSKIVTLEALDITGSRDTVKGIVQVMELVKDSIMVDARDNQSYSVIKINHTWWMTEDLAYGQIISNSTSPSDNRITERWIYPDSMSGSNFKQGFYTEMEATEYGRKKRAGNLSGRLENADGSGLLTT